MNNNNKVAKKPEDWEELQNLDGLHPHLTPEYRTFKKWLEGEGKVSLERMIARMLEKAC